jgi:hypothetical protein
MSETYSRKEIHSENEDIVHFDWVDKDTAGYYEMVPPVVGKELIRAVVEVDSLGLGRDSNGAFRLVEKDGRYIKQYENKDDYHQ